MKINGLNIHFTFWFVKYCEGLSDVPLGLIINFFENQLILVRAVNCRSCHPRFLYLWVKFTIKTSSMPDVLPALLQTVCVLTTYILSSITLAKSSQQQIGGIRLQNSYPNPPPPFFPAAYCTPPIWRTKYLISPLLGELIKSTNLYSM